MTKRANARGALVGILACVIFTAWATFTSVKVPALNRVLLDLGPLNYPFHPFLIGIFNPVILFAVGWAASLWFDRNQPQPGAVANSATIA